MNTEITIPVRVQVLKDSIADLQSQLSNLNIDSNSFKTISKYIQSMTQEMTRFEAMTSRSFNSQNQFNKANKSIEKMEDTLSKARIAMNDIKFPELKLSGSQKAEWDNLNKVLNDAMQGFDNVKERVKNGILGDTTAQKLFEGMDSKYLEKSYDQLFSMIDSKTQQLGRKMSDAKQKLSEFNGEKNAHNKRIDALTSNGISPEAIGQVAFDRFFTSTANGIQFKNIPGQRTPMKTQFMEYLKQQFYLDDKDIESLTKQLGEKGGANKLSQIFQKMSQNNMFTRAADSTNFAKENKLHQAVKEAEEAYAEYQKILKKFEDASATGSNGQKAGEVGDAYNKLQEKIKNVNLEMEKFQENAKKSFSSGASQTLSPFQAELNNFKNVLQQTNTEFLKLEQTKRTFTNMKMAVSNFMGFYQVLNLTKRGIKEAMTHIKDLDSVMNKISIVTDKSTSDLWGQVNAYSDMAQKYGVSIKGAYEVSQIYYQQGLDTADVLTLTNETLKLSKISGLDYATTTDYMTTAMRGFKMETSDASRVVDVYSNLAAHTAVSQGELAVGMSKTASSLESVGASFEESSAMIATMVAVTRESSTNIGSAMKSIASRYGEMKKDMSAAFDAEGEAISYNKVDTALQSVGISLKDSNGQFRNMTDVIIELGEQWDTLDSVQQRYIATQFAGNRQQSRFLALVSNVDLLKSNLNYALDSENVGDVQALKALDSIESRTEQLKVAYQQMYTTIGAEDMWKGALSGLTNFMGTLNTLPKAFSKIPIGAMSMIYDVVNVIKNVGNIAIEGVSKTLLNGLLNDKELPQKAADFMSKTSDALQKGAKDNAEKNQETGKQITNAVDEGQRQAQTDKTQPAAKPQEVEKKTEPNKIAQNVVAQTQEAVEATQGTVQPIEISTTIKPPENTAEVAQDTQQQIEAAKPEIKPEVDASEAAEQIKEQVGQQESNIPETVETEVKANISQAEAAINSLNGKTVTIDVNANTPNIGVDGGGSGSASAAGNTKTLMGELGPEMYVSNGQYHTAGVNGPEMVDLPSDSIVFNHLQTEDLLKNQKTSSNGRPVTNERKATAMASGNTTLEEVLAQILPSPSMLKILAEKYPIATGLPSVWRETPFGNMAATLARQVQEKGFTNDFNEQFSNAITQSIASGEIDGSRLITYLKNTLKDMESGVNAVESYATTHPNDSVAFRNARIRRQYLEQDQAWFDQSFGNMSIPEDTKERHQTYLQSQAEIANEKRLQQETAERKEREERKAWKEQQEQAEMDAAIAAAQAEKKQKGIEDFNAANEDFLTAIGKPESTDWTAGIPIEDAIRLRKKQLEAQEQMLQESGIPRTPSQARIASGQLSGSMIEQRRSGLWSHWTTDKNGNYVGEPLGQYPQYAPGITKNAHAGYYMTMEELKAEAELIRRGESINPLLGAKTTLNMIEDRPRQLREKADIEKREQEYAKQQQQENAVIEAIDDVSSHMSAVKESTVKEKSTLENLQRLQELRADIANNPDNRADLVKERQDVEAALEKQGIKNAAKMSAASLQKKITTAQRNEAIANDKQKLIDTYKGNKELMRKMMPQDDEALRASAAHSANPDIRFEALKQLRDEINAVTDASDTATETLKEDTNAKQENNDKIQEGLEAQEHSKIKEFRDSYTQDNEGNYIPKDPSKGIMLSESEFNAEIAKRQAEIDAQQQIEIQRQEAQKQAEMRRQTAEEAFASRYTEEEGQYIPKDTSKDIALSAEEFEKQMKTAGEKAANINPEEIMTQMEETVNENQKAIEEDTEQTKSNTQSKEEEQNSTDEHQKATDENTKETKKDTIKKKLQSVTDKITGGDIKTFGRSMTAWGSALNMATGLIQGEDETSRLAKGGLMAGAGIIKGIGGALTGNPMAVVTGIMSVWNGISTVIEDDKERLQRLTKESEELNNKAKQEQASYKSLKSGVEQLDKLAEKQYESAEAAEEYQNAVDNLTNKFPELVSGFDEFGNAIVDMSNAEEALQAARQRSVTATYNAMQAEQDRLEQEKKINISDTQKQLGNASNYVTALFSNIQKTEAQGIMSYLTSDNGVDFASNMSQLTQLDSGYAWNKNETSKEKILQSLGWMAAFSPDDVYEYSMGENGEITSIDATKQILARLHEANVTQLDEQGNVIGIDIQEALKAIADLNTVEATQLRNALQNVDTSLLSFNEEDVQEKITNLNNALSTGSIDLINKAYQDLIPFMDAINYMSIPEDSLLSDQRKNLQNAIEQATGLIQDQRGIELSHATNAKSLVSSYISSQHLFDDFIQDESGLLNVISNNFAKDYTDEYQRQLDVGELYDWDDYRSENAGAMNEAADQANNFWKDLIAHGVETSQQFSNMLKNLGDYRKSDFDQFSIIGDTWYEIDDQIYQQIDERSKTIRDTLSKYAMTNAPESRGGLIESIKESGWLGEWDLASAKVQTYSEGQYLKTIFDQQTSLYEGGFTSDAEEFGKAALSVFNDILTLKDPNVRNALWKSIDKNKLKTKEGIDKIIKDIDASESKEDDELKPMLESMRNLLQDSMALALESTKDDFVEKWEDSSKTLKSLTAGIDLKDADSILTSEAGKSMGLTFKDFTTNGDNLVLQEQDAQRYMDAYFESVNTTLQERSTQLENIKNSFGQLDENGDLIANAEKFAEGSGLTEQDLKDLNALLGTDEYKKYLDEKGRLKGGDDLQALYKAIKDRYRLVSDSLDALGLYIEAAQAAVQKSYQWSKGDYSSLQETFSAKGIENYTSRLRELASGARYEDWELNEPDIKNAIDQMTDGYSALLSDILEKGTENINVNQYKGIISEDISKIAEQLSDDMDPAEFVAQYYQMAGWTIKEANQKILDINRQSREEIYDEIKSLQDLTGKPGDQIALNAIAKQAQKQQNKLLKSKKQNLNLVKQHIHIAEAENTIQKEIDELQAKNPLADLAAQLSQFNAILSDTGILTIGEDADMLNIAKTLSNYANSIGSDMGNELQDFVQTIQKGYTDAITKGIEGGMTYTEAADLIRKGRNLGIDLSNADFRKTAEGLQLSSDAAISLYDSLSNVDTFSRRIVFDKLSASLKKNNSNYKTSTALLSHINQLQDRIKQQQERITSEVNKSSSAHEKLKERLEREKALASQIALNDFGNASDGWDFMSGEMPGSIENTIAYYQSWSTAMQSMKQWANSGRTDTSFVKLLKHVAEIADATGESLTFLGKKIGGKDGASYSELMQSIMSAFEVDEKGAFFDNVKLAKLGFNMQEGASTMYKNDIFGRIDSYFKMTDEAVTEWNNYIGGLASVKEQMKKDKKEVEDFFTEAGDFDTNAFRTFLSGNDKVKDAWNKFAEQTNINGDTLKSILDGTSKTKLSAEEYNATMKSVFQMMFSEDWDPSNYAQSLAEQWENTGFTGNTTVNGMYMEAREGQVVIQDSETKKYVTPDGQTYDTTDKAFKAIYQAQTDELEASAQKYGAKTSPSTAANGGQITTYYLGNGEFELNVQKNPDGTIALSDQDGNNLGTNIDKAIDTLYQNYADKMHEAGQSAMSQAEWLADSGLSSGLTQMAQDVADGVTAAFTSLTEAGGPINENGIPIKVKPEFESENPFDGQTFKVNVELNPVSDEIKAPEQGPRNQAIFNTEGFGVNIEQPKIPSTIGVTRVQVQYEEGEMPTGTEAPDAHAKIQYEEGEKPEGVTAPDGTGKINYTVGTIDIPTGVVATGIINYKKGYVEKPSEAGGSAGLATGNAHAKSTLMGELGPEMVVSNGRYFVVGQNGPEMVDLDKDAIVFNHLQTQSLLTKGTSSTRGKAITNERNAVAYARGSMNGGPAKVGVESMLIPPTGGNAPRNSKGILSGLQNAEEKVNEALEAFIKELDKWYNYLQEIARLEEKITYQEQLRSKINSDLIKNGSAYYKSLRQSVIDLNDELEVNQALVIAQQNELKTRVAQLSNGPFGAIYKLDENGQVKYKNGDVRDQFMKEFGQKDDNSPEDTSKNQYEWLKKQGFEDYMKWDKSGKEIQFKNEKGEENAAAYKTAVQAFWDRLDAQLNEVQGLVDSVNEHEQAVLEAQEKQNELVKEMQDNQMELENQVLDAIVDIRERTIKELEDEKEAYQESADKMINGLSEALNKEREMYEMQEDQAETDRMRRRLAILLSSNGSASEITDLQQQIRQRDKDMYFNEQQQQIDAIKEASDLEVERLDQQIAIQNEILAYQKEHGLLWNDVYNIMNSEDPNKIAAFINEENSKLWANSPMKQTEDMRNAIFNAEKWVEYKNDLNGNFGSGEDAISAKVKAIYESLLENNGMKEWENYVAAVKQATGQDISGDTELYNAYMAKYKELADPNAAKDAAQAVLDTRAAAEAKAAEEAAAVQVATEMNNKGTAANPGNTNNLNTGKQQTYEGVIAYYKDGKLNSEYVTVQAKSPEEAQELMKKKVPNGGSLYEPGVSKAYVIQAATQAESDNGVQDSINKTGANVNMKSIGTTKVNGKEEKITNAGEYYNTKYTAEATEKALDNALSKIKTKGRKAPSNGATGNAFAKGTLLGELGPEAFVSGGQFHIAGKSGAEFVNLPDDAIVFNHAQTARLLQTGHTSRGDALNESKAIGDDIRSSYIKNFWNSVDRNKATMNATNAQAYMGDGSSALGQIINTDGGVIIEHAEVNMNVEQIANDYDAKRAGEQALEEMLRIARKNSVTSVRR